MIKGTIGASSWASELIRGQGLGEVMIDSKVARKLIAAKHYRSEFKTW